MSEKIYLGIAISIDFSIYRRLVGKLVYLTLTVFIG